MQARAIYCLSLCWQRGPLPYRWPRSCDWWKLATDQRHADLRKHCRTSDAPTTSCHAETSSKRRATDCFSPFFSHAQIAARCLRSWKRSRVETPSTQLRSGFMKCPTSRWDRSGAQTLWALLLEQRAWRSFLSVLRAPQLTPPPQRPQATLESKPTLPSRCQTAVSSVRFLRHRRITTDVRCTHLGDSGPGVESCALAFRSPWKLALGTTGTG